VLVRTSVWGGQKKRRRLRGATRTIVVRPGRPQRKPAEPGEHHVDEGAQPAQRRGQIEVVLGGAAGGQVQSPKRQTLINDTQGRNKIRKQFFPGTRPQSGAQETHGTLCLRGNGGAGNESRRAAATTIQEGGAEMLLGEVKPNTSAGLPGVGVHLHIRKNGNRTRLLDSGC